MKLLEIKNNKLSQQQLDAILTPEVKDLGFLFRKNGFDLRVVGGAVRDIMVGREPKDIDLATDATPTEMLDFLFNAGLTVIPIGIDHGTITALGPETSEPYEITTLRIDVETTGRHATVEFTRDWKQDAERRDLTFNAMSIDMDGNLYDYFGGAQDLRDYVTRFVGDADQRIKEDYLRILRFFRFVGRMDKPTINQVQADAIKRNAEGLLQISGERIWMEMSKILSGNHVGFIVDWMCKLDVAEQINIPCLVAPQTIDRIRNLTSNPITVLSVLLDNESAIQTIIFQWKLKNVEKDLLTFLFAHNNISESIAKVMLVDGIPLEWVNELAAKQNRMSVVTRLTNWQVPVFPVTGQDLIDLGWKPGPEFGGNIDNMKRIWKRSDFTLDKDSLLSTLHSLKESVQWAMKPEHAQGAGRNDLTDPNYEVMWLNIIDIFKYTDKGQKLNVRDHTGGPNSIGNRIEMAKQHWVDGGHMNLSLIGWNDYSNTFNFTDGRHRLVTAYQLSNFWAPVLVEKDSVEKVRN